jgi:riboflavin synthase
MFTGIVEKQGSVLNYEQSGDSLKVHVASGFSDLILGESVAVNGVCLTVAEDQAYPLSSGNAFFFLSPETLSRSNLGTLTQGTVLNLERAVTLQTRLSGHLVQGHVDGKAKLLDVLAHSDTYSLRFEISRELSRYCVEKGSVSLNGISLTLNSVTDIGTDPKTSATILGVTIIPHTWSHTNLSHLKPGDLVNVELDIVAKYLERLCQR